MYEIKRKKQKSCMQNWPYTPKSPSVHWKFEKSKDEISKMLQKRQVNNSTPDIANELVWLKEISKGL